MRLGEPECGVRPGGLEAWLKGVLRGAALGEPPDATLMVGDNLDADVGAAQTQIGEGAGLSTALSGPLLLATSCTS